METPDGHLRPGRCEASDGKVLNVLCFLYGKSQGKVPDNLVCTRYCAHPYIWLKNSNFRSNSCIACVLSYSMQPRTIERLCVSTVGKAARTDNDLIRPLGKKQEKYRIGALAQALSRKDISSCKGFPSLGSNTYRTPNPQEDRRPKMSMTSPFDKTNILLYVQNNGPLCDNVHPSGDVLVLL